MFRSSRSITLGSALYFFAAFAVAIYFMFGAVQGKSGLFRRIQIEAEAQRLSLELATLQKQLSEIEVKTHRLSDSYLDLDLLDQQAREILGYIRADEIVIR
jgi:cell division protein FtsB